MAIPRLCQTNNILNSTTVITSSDEQSSFPSAWLKDQLRSREWQSQIGWTADADFNDEVIFSTNDGGRIGHIAPGTYATGAAYATAVQSAFNAAGYNPRTAMSSALKAWFRADSVVVDGSGLIQTWTDLSGNGNDATQASSSNRARLVANATGGRPAGYWDGTNNAMRYNTTTALSSLLASDGQGTVIVIYNLDSDASASDVLWCATAGGSTIYAGAYWGGGTSFVSTLVDSASATKAATKSSGALAQWQSHVWEYDKTNVQSYSNNADTAAVANAASTNSINATGLASVFSIGCDTANATKGYIAEILVLNRGLNETERRGILQYLVGRYPALTNSTTVVGWTVTLGCTYDGTAKKFTISRTGGAGNISLLGNSGVPSIDLGAQALPDLGFSTAADKTGATSYLADNVAYQSRHWLKADLGSAIAITEAVAFDHNSGASGTYTLQGSDIDSWVSPAVSQVLSGDSTIRMAFPSATRRWFRLVINDVQNSAGYNTLGIWSVGSYVLATYAYLVSLKKTREELSVIGYAPFGSHLVDERPQRWAWNVPWEDLPDADRAMFESFIASLPLGKNFFISWGPSFDNTDTNYVFRRDPMEFQGTTATPLWNTALSLAEALD